MAQRDSPVPRLPPQIFTDLVRMWFSQRQTTEQMMRGSVNEAVVLHYLPTFEWIHSLFPCDMVGSPEFCWNDCSADGVALLQYSREAPDIFEWGTNAAVCIGGHRYLLDTVEVKKVTSRHSLDPYLVHVTDDMQMMHLCSPSITKYLREEHIAQVVHPMPISRNNCSVYVCASRTGIVFNLLLLCPCYALTTITGILNSVADELVSWAHAERTRIRSAASEKDKEMVMSRLPF